MVRKFIWGLAVSSLIVATSFAQQPSAPEVEDLTTPEKIAEAERRIDLGEQTNDPVPMQDGMELLRRVLADDPANAEANLLFAETLIKAAEMPETPQLFQLYGGLDAARDRFKAVLEQEPNNYRANIGYGRILLANRLWRQAASYLETALRVAGTEEREAEVKKNLAIAQLNMGNFNLAIDYAEDAVRINPQEIEAHTTLVQIYRDASRRDSRYLESALASVDKYVTLARQELDLQPWDRHRLRQLGGAYELQIAILRDYAGSFYRKNARRETTNELMTGKEAEAAAALNMLATKRAELALVRHNLELHDAATIAELCVELEPRNVEYLENLAGLYQRTNNLPKAIEMCQRILALDEDHAGALQFLKSQGVAPNPIEPPEPESE